jgi:hypothetical protein
MSEATRQAHSQDETLAKQTTKTTEVSNNAATSDKPNNDQTSPPLVKGIGVPFPPGMTLEIRQANIKAYWESKRLADETARNTEFNKNIAAISEADHGQASHPLSRKKKKVSISLSEADHGQASPPLSRKRKRASISNSTPEEAQ